MKALDKLDQAHDVEDDVEDADEYNDDDGDDEVVVDVADDEEEAVWPRGRLRVVRGLLAVLLHPLYEL